MSDDVILSDLRRRIVAISDERDAATLALSHEEEKRDELRSIIRSLRRENGELRRYRGRADEMRDRIIWLERELNATRAKLDRAVTRVFEIAGAEM